MPHPIVELGGKGPPLHLAPANGFPPDTYRPMVEPLRRTHRVVSLPPRALWPDGPPPPAAPGSWDTLAEDLLTGLRQHRLRRVVGVGHSFGAVATLLAAVREPGRFRALCFLDPTMLPLPIMEQLRVQKQRGEMSFRPLVQGALKRRAEFASAKEAFDYWRDRPLFADWSDEALMRYARAMLRRRKKGEGFTLAWSPAWEAWYYASFHAESWDALERLDPALPVLVVRGERSDTFLPAAEALFRERRPGAEVRVLAGRGHLFPQAAPGEAGRTVAEWLDRLGSLD